MDNKLGPILKERRKAKGLRLRQLATLSGVSASHIARIERGERFPAGRILRKLAEPLGFSELKLCKLAGFIARDAIDEFKKSIKKEIRQAMRDLNKKVDIL